ncbi:MAG: BlaI/MecI/CopY family transcriptional regulator [Candidatus Hodarchaeota archaeon]
MLKNEIIADLDKKLLEILNETYPKGATIDDLMEKLGRKTHQCQERVASMLTFLYTKKFVERKLSQRGFIWFLKCCKGCL